jgi:hypothetical protein
MNWPMRRVSSGAVGVEGLAKAAFEAWTRAILDPHSIWLSRPL